MYVKLYDCSSAFVRQEWGQEIPRETRDNFTEFTRPQTNTDYRTSVQRCAKSIVRTAYNTKYNNKIHILIFVSTRYTCIIVCKYIEQKYNNIIYV